MEEDEFYEPTYTNDNCVNRDQEEQKMEGLDEDACT